MIMYGKQECDDEQVPKKFNLDDWEWGDVEINQEALRKSIAENVAEALTNTLKDEPPTLHLGWTGDDLSFYLLLGEWAPQWKFSLRDGIEHLIEIVKDDQIVGGIDNLSEMAASLRALANSVDDARRKLIIKEV